MAEILLSSFVQILIDKLTSAAFKKLTHQDDIHSQLKKLERWLLQIQDVLSDAGQRAVTQKSVAKWLYELQDLAYDIDDVLDDFATEAMHDELSDESGASTRKVRKLFRPFSTSSPQRASMNDKLNDITANFKDLVEEKNTLGLIVKVGKSKNTNRRLESSSLVDVHGIVGRQGEKEALLQQLLGVEPCKQNFSIVPIVGMGGIGKTTLARLLYNDTKVKDCFEVKAWVCVSDEFDIIKISKIIFQTVTGGIQEFTSLNLLQEELSKKLAEKRFLLVLDDVWSESHEDWEVLARPFLVGAPGSKIIVTTRKTTVASTMGCRVHYPLQILSDEDALSLFAQHALEERNFDSHQTLESYGKGIVKKCDGLPLALIALGRLLWEKRNEEEWEQLLNSDIWSFPKENEINPALRLSYLDLPAHLKQLFVYCSLFPKDYMFDKEELILLWMAEGFLHQSAASMSIESFGRECFEELLSRSFFQHAPNDELLYAMHDLMNDLATSVAGDFFFRLDYETKEDVKKEAVEKCRHMSFISQKYGVYGRFKALERAKSMRTLLAVSVDMKNRWTRFYISNQILDELLPQLPLLRVLSLSEYHIREVPESIGSLKHLRYLNLSQTEITHLPEKVGNLYNLQTLLVCGCKSLTKLPNSFSKLKNLRHLDMSDTPLLEKIPVGIGELKSLQTLPKVIIEGGNGFALTELKDIKDLHGRLSIKGLHKVNNAMDAKNATLLEKKLDDLEMEWSDVFDGARNEALEKEVLNMLKPHNVRLKKLGIVSYGGMEFPSWVGDPSFLRLEHVELRGCRKCTSLPPLGQLPVLKELFVERMDGVKVVGSEFLGNGNCPGGVAFPSLEILSFKDMQGWEEWSTSNGDTGTAFPCLRVLNINSCDKLVEASLEALPSLRVLEIAGCGDGVLRSLVHAGSSITKLKIRNISGLTLLHGGIIKYLGEVEELSISRCVEMRYLWESEAEACKILVNLRELEVGYCNNLVGIGEKEEDDCGSSLTSLRQVKIQSCKSLKSYSCPNGIEKLKMYGCSSITSVSFPRGGQKKLKRLDIFHCENLLEEESVGGGGEKSRMLLNGNMSLLKSVAIINWPNLKSFPDLSCFVHLASLKIWWCKNLESFPDEELPNLPSLAFLEIQDCPSIDGSFPRGNWPPKLTCLTIGGLKTPISMWGPQNFPTSLVSITLNGGSSLEEVGSDSSWLSHLLPSSLTSLYISGFEKLESLSMGLQHLTSLRKLEFFQCPNLIHLPETLPPSLLHLQIWSCPNINHLPVTLLHSLLSLHIDRCPKLKERCSRRGSYWPLISHIPRFIIADPSLPPILF